VYGSIRSIADTCQGRRHRGRWLRPHHHEQFALEQRTQVDLFLDSLVNAPIKDDRALMEFPFFSLEKRPRVEPIVYDDGTVRIEIQPGPKGIATIWDKDLLIYIASLINDRIERGAEVSRTVLFTARDFLTLVQRGTSNVSYEQFKDTLFRLRSTTIVTSIVADNEREERGFGWIDNFRIVRREQRSGRKVMAAIEVTLNDWMFRAIVKDRRVLTISPAYFNLTMGLERRLYELARKHCGYQERWAIGLPKLAEKCGSRRELRKLRAELAGIVERDSLPDYTIALQLPVSAAPGRARIDRIQVVFAPRPGTA
jgi:plasmid replication initiation protein